MRENYDLVVIGTGTAAATVASACRAAGWKVAIIDSRPFGGTCALRGCDPKKVLVGAAEVVDSMRRMQTKGVRGEGSIDWTELMKFKRTFTGPMPKYREDAFAKAGIAAYHGPARFAGRTSVRVGDDTLEAKHVVIATGAVPADLKVPGARLVTTSDKFLELESLPARIVFIGGGYISFEFAHVAARAGAKATILHRGARPLAGFDPDLVDRLVEHTRSLGVDVRVGAEVKAIEEVSSGPSGTNPSRIPFPRGEGPGVRGNGGFVVRAAGAGGEQKFEADLVVHGAGRVPEIADLDLKTGGVEGSEKGVKVNEFLQSASNQAVYAAGDCAASGGPPLTPVAGHEGGIVAENLLHGNRARPNYAGVPSVVFTLPPLATVGLQEQAARQQGLRFKVNHANTSGWYSSRRVGEKCAGFKVLVEEGSGRILGAHLLGPHAEDTINLFGLAIRHGLTARDLKEMIYVYPTHASDVQYMV